MVTKIFLSLFLLLICILSCKYIDQIVARKITEQNIINNPNVQAVIPLNTMADKKEITTRKTLFIDSLLASASFYIFAIYGFILVQIWMKELKILYLSYTK